MGPICGEYEDCYDTPCSGRRSKYRQTYRCSEIAATVTCVTFGGSYCDGKCSTCSSYVSSTFISCCP
jgi:hypothetical protein